MASSFLLVRALYDFNSSDSSSLSFRKNDIIQVMTRLESGWWDGLCNGERGWFPSNYVSPLEEDELLEDDDNDQLSDWIPQETPDGEIFYINERTGESTWGLPVDDNESVTTMHSTTIRDAASIHGGSSTDNYHTYVHRTPDSPRSGSVSSLRPPKQLPEHWIQQPTEDGTTYYYLNTRTQETRWTYPGGDTTTATSSNSDIGEEKDDDDDLDNRAATAVASARVEEAVAEEEEVEAADKESIASSRGSRLSTSTIGTIQQRQQQQQQQVNERLPPNWGQKTTPQGRVYYFNKLTDQTTWSLDNVDMDTGQLINTENGTEITDSHNQDIQPPPTPIAAIPTQRRKLSASSMSTVQQNPNETLTWESLSNNIIMAIHQLNLAAKENQKHNYTDCTNAIVESIRIMLYASGTVEKESPAIRQNRNLRIYHRHIMASLSKLVLSTKVASGVWPPPDASQKMKNDADEVLVAIRQFVQAAEHAVDIKRVDPKILENPNGGSWRSNNLSPASQNGRHSNRPPSIATNGINGETNGNSTSSPSSPTAPARSLAPDLLASLDHNSRTVNKTITSLLNHIQKSMETSRGTITNNSAFIPQLISQTRQVVNQVGQFLSLIEDINLEDLDESSLGSINEFKVAKQALYNNIAGLVMCTQSATDPLAPHNALEQVLVSTNVVDKSVKDVVIATKFLVEEKDAQDQRRMQNSMRRRSSSSSSNSNSSTANDIPIKTRRASNLTSGFENVRESNGSTLVEEQSSIDGADDSNISTVAPTQPQQTTTTGLATVPEDDVMAQTSTVVDSEVNEDVTDDHETPVSPLSDGGSSMIGGRPHASSRLRSESSVSSSAFDAASIQTHPPLQRSRTQSVAPSSFSSDFPYSSSPPNSAPTGKGGPSGAQSPRNNNKAEQFFGEKTTRQREEKPWFLGYDYDTQDMLFNMEGVVKGGTLAALVERLTMHDYLDSNFIATFLLTYRSFTTSEEFFDMLVKRFTIEPPEGLTNEETELWVEKKQTPIRLRVFNIIKSWLENYYIDEDDSLCLEKMKEFAKNTVHEHMAFAAVSLERVIEKRLQQPKDATFKDLIPTNPVSPPPSILPRNMKKLKFLDLDPTEISRQLTIIESKLYNKIRPVECLNKAWSKEEGGEIAENIKAMILNSNQITGWVAESILHQEEIRKRCALIRHFVTIADRCRALNNFNSLTAIISGLNSAPIHRLRRTWEMVNAKTIQTLENLNKIMNSTKNFLGYREMLHNVNPPCVPFLGVYLTDLTFIEDGNPNILKKNRTLFNFSKRMKTAEVIREIQQYQSVPYFLHPVQEIQIFLKSHLQESRDVSELYDLSLKIEPREREDEKIARLLQESGFL